MRQSDMVKFLPNYVQIGGRTRRHAVSRESPYHGQSDVRGLMALEQRTLCSLWPGTQRLGACDVTTGVLDAPSDGSEDDDWRRITMRTPMAWITVRAV